MKHMALNVRVPTLLAAFLFVLVAVFHLWAILEVSNGPMMTDDNPITEALVPALLIVSTLKVLLSLLIAVFLLRRKLWAYVVALVVIIPTFVVNLISAFRMERNDFFQLAFSTGILICLYLGREDLKKTSKDLR